MKKFNTQFGHYPQTFRSDRGEEYMSNNLQNFLASKRITFECTVSNTPQQNGISERKNRTLDKNNISFQKFATSFVG